MPWWWWYGRTDNLRSHALVCGGRPRVLLGTASDGGAASCRCLWFFLGNPSPPGYLNSRPLRAPQGLQFLGGGQGRLRKLFGVWGPEQNCVLLLRSEKRTLKHSCFECLFGPAPPNYPFKTPHIPTNPRPLDPWKPRSLDTTPI